MRALRLSLLCLISAITAQGSAAWAASEFKAIGPGPAVMFDAPSNKGRKLYAAPAGMPVEVVITSGDWSRVRDAAGELAWVENKSLTNNRMLVVEAAQAVVRRAADETAPVVAEPVASSWVKVRHRDGDIGYAKASDVWGE